MSGKTEKQKEPKDSGDILVIGEEVFNLAKLRDPPIGFWELLEKNEMIDRDGTLTIEGFKKRFDVIHLVLNATRGAEVIDQMILGGEGPVPRSLVTKMKTSELQDMTESIRAVLSGRRSEDVTDIRPMSEKFSKPDISSVEPTGGTSETSEG